MSVSALIVAVVLGWFAVSLAIGLYVGRVIRVSSGTKRPQRTSSIRADETSKTNPRTLSR